MLPRTGTPHRALEALGWDETFASAFGRYRGAYLPGRVSCRQRTVFDVITADGSVSVHSSGTLQRTVRLPVVGDFVVLLDQPGEVVTRDLFEQLTEETGGPYHEIALRGCVANQVLST